MGEQPSFYQRYQQAAKAGWKWKIFGHCIDFSFLPVQKYCGEESGRDLEASLNEAVSSWVLNTWIIYKCSYVDEGLVTYSI